MSTLAVTNTLASVFVPIGIAGAVIAIVCALVAAFALTRGAAGLAGGAIGVWIVGALLSLCASFASQWTPFFVSAGALVAAFVVAGVLRMLARTARAAKSTAQAAPVKAASAKAPAKDQARPGLSIPARPITDTIRVAS